MIVPAETEEWKFKVVIICDIVVVAEMSEVRMIWLCEAQDNDTWKTQDSVSVINGSNNENRH